MRGGAINGIWCLSGGDKEQQTRAVSCCRGRELLLKTRRWKQEEKNRTKSSSNKVVRSTKKSTKSLFARKLLRNATQINE